jgi:phosphonopyruvate decarboxylase
VAFAAGVWLGGGTGAVLMQNSGLGNAVNPLVSLAIPYRIPMLLAVSWRGEAGRPDAVHHFPMGAATHGLLRLLCVEPRTLRDDADLAELGSAVRAGLAGRRQEALVVPRGLFPKEPAAAPAPAAAPPTPVLGPQRFEGGRPATRAEAVAAIHEACRDVAIVSTTGYASRELALHGPHDGRFYMQGSMGFALAIALGVARVRPRQPVLVLDGDGALLMRLGSLATAAVLRPPQLVHVVLDNGTYGSTGGQPTVSAGVDFPAAAIACGYRSAATCAGREGMSDALAWLLGRLGSGPALLHLRISAVEGDARERPERAPHEIADAFRAWLATRPL